MRAGWHDRPAFDSSFENLQTPNCRGAKQTTHKVSSKQHSIDRSIDRSVTASSQARTYLRTAIEDDARVESDKSVNVPLNVRAPNEAEPNDDGADRIELNIT